MHLTTLCSSAPCSVDGSHMVSGLGWAGRENLRQLTSMPGALARWLGSHAQLSSPSPNSFMAFLWGGLTSRAVDFFLGDLGL